MTLGQKLKKARLDRGLTQAQVVGDRITRNMLSQLENDLASPSVGTLEYLASVLGVQAAWLLADEKEEEAAGRTEQLRACYRGGDWAGCLELAQELQPDDEQALLLALAAAQCALHALEAERFAAASGYDVAETPYASGHAGYKDWFLQDFRRPGFTIEAGSGENPLPLSQFPDIWSDNLGILLGGMAAVL